MSISTDVGTSKKEKMWVVGLYPYVVLFFRMVGFFLFQQADNISVGSKIAHCLSLYQVVGLQV